MGSCFHHCSCFTTWNDQQIMGGKVVFSSKFQLFSSRQGCIYSLVCSCVDITYIIREMHISFSTSLMFVIGGAIQIQLDPRIVKTICKDISKGTQYSKAVLDGCDLHVTQQISLNNFNATNIMEPITFCNVNECN